MEDPGIRRLSGPSTSGQIAVMMFRDVVQLVPEALPTLNNVNDRRASFNCFTLLSTPPSVAACSELFIVGENRNLRPNRVCVPSLEVLNHGFV